MTPEAIKRYKRWCKEHPELVSRFPSPPVWAQKVPWFGPYAREVPA